MQISHRPLLSATRLRLPLAPLSARFNSATAPSTVASGTRPGPQILDTAPLESYGPEHRTVPLRKKPGHIPVVQRWSIVLPEQELFIGFFGVQARNAEELASSPFMKWAEGGLLDHPGGPSTHDHARYTDRAGYHNHVVAAYWVNEAEFSAWRADPAVEAWWTSPERLSDDTGVWREVLRVPAERLETIYWLDYPAGVSSNPAVKLYPTPYCGYYGAMRDRLPVAANDPLDPPLGATMQRCPRDTARARWRIRAPHNVAVIRSGNTWGAMDDEQMADYQAKLAPPLERGMDYLQDEPQDAGCISLRFHDALGPSGTPKPEAHALGYFLSLGDMERWSEKHRSHAAIYSAAMARYKRYGSRNQLRTWHEVYVLPEDREQLFEYTNCHSDTGFLPYFQGDKLA